jgi:hypothetical protein
MPAPAFTLRVPTADSFRSLVTDAVRTYLRISGEDTSSAADTFVGSVSTAVDALATEGDDLDVVVRTRPSEVEVQLTCGTAARTLTHTLAGRP